LDSFCCTSDLEVGASFRFLGKKLKTVNPFHLNKYNQLAGTRSDCQSLALELQPERVGVRILISLRCFMPGSVFRATDDQESSNNNTNLLHSKNVGFDNRFIR